jgi:cell wall-associated NlpC family hydrolase
VAANPAVVQAIIAAAQRTGADPIALLATGLQESGLRYNAVGDQGTSFGPYQYHRGGALGSHTPAWAMSNAEIQDEAQRFAQNQIHHGVGAAALQRPADPTGYAAGVESRIPTARALLAQYRGASPPATLPTAARHPPSASLTGGVGASGASQAAFLQSIIDQNAQLAGIPTLRVPISSPLAPGVNVPLASTTIPKNTPPEAHNIVGLARQYLGTKYTWGGTSPKTGFDCSGFAQYLYGKVGVRLPRTSEQQYTVGRPVPQQALKAGDLVFFKGTDGPANDVGHEGIYVGNGHFIHAPHSGDVVKVSNLFDPYYIRHYAGARRVG